MTSNKTTHLQSNVKLVKGTFLPVEAAEVLLSLLAYKIKFHTVQLLGNKEEQNENEITPSRQRIIELEKAKTMVKDLILKARDEGYELEIDGEIKINLKKLNLKQLA